MQSMICYAFTLFQILLALSCFATFSICFLVIQDTATVELSCKPILGVEHRLYFLDE